MKILYVLKTGLFFGVVGGMIGSAFVFALILHQKSVPLHGNLFNMMMFFVLGYILIGLPVSGLTGVLYSLMRVTTGSVYDCNVYKKIIFGVVTTIIMTILWFYSNLYSEVERVHFSFDTLVFKSPTILFILVCTLATIYLHTLGERRITFFKPPTSSKPL